MIRRPPRSTRTYIRFPYTTLFRSIAVLHIGRMDQYDKGATIGIYHCMAFASHGLLAFVVTTRSACFGGLHALAVDDCRGWCWFSPCPDAIDPNEMMIEAFEYPKIGRAHV